MMIDFFPNPYYICNFCALLHWLGPSVHHEPEVGIVGMVPYFTGSSTSLTSLNTTFAIGFFIDTLYLIKESPYIARLLRVSVTDVEFDLFV